MAHDQRANHPRSVDQKALTMNSEIQSLIEQRNALEAEIAAKILAGKADAIAKVRAYVADNELTVADVFPPKKARTSGPTGPVAPKYRNAEGKTWTGRGMQPTWLREAIAAGATLESFLIPVPVPVPQTTEAEVAAEEPVAVAEGEL